MTERKKTQAITTFKGFDKDLKCRNFQFEIGKEYEEDDIKICNKGFHACENPLDIFRYYTPANTRFCEVEQYGTIQKHDEDTKVCSSKIRIKAEINIHDIINKGIKFIFEKTTLTKETTNTDQKKQASNSGYSGAASNSGYSGAASNSGYSGAASNSGYRGAASNSGYRGAASNSGDSGAASNSGDSGAASNSGYRGAASNSGDSGAAFSIGAYSTVETLKENSIACGVGIENKAKGVKGSWLVLAEWVEYNNKWELKNVKSAKVDGKKIKENVFYVLKDNKIRPMQPQKV